MLHELSNRLKKAHMQNPVFRHIILLV
jgi:hypothetical protein